MNKLIDRQDLIDSVLEILDENDDSREGVRQVIQFIVNEKVAQMVEVVEDFDYQNGSMVIVRFGDEERDLWDWLDDFAEWDDGEEN